ncbi:MAG: SRPBCC domain-containing protein [Sphingobacteriales bacterium]
MAARIKHELFFPHRPEAVWEYLTNAELMKLWLMPSDFKPVAGHEFTFRVNPIPRFDFDGIIYCEVLEIEPFKKLSYSWKLGPGDGTINVDSVVRWEPQATDKGTELLLDHGDFTVLKNMGIFEGMNKGWLENMHKILNCLNETNNGTKH